MKLFGKKKESLPQAVSTEMDNPNIVYDKSLPWSIRANAAKELTNQAELGQIVKNLISNEDWMEAKIAEEVLKLINDENVLYNITMECEGYVARNAIVKITDQEKLSAIAQNAKATESRDFACRYLTDSDLLQKLAAEGFPEAIRNPQFCNKEMLRSIAIENENSFIRYNAICNPNLDDSARKDILVCEKDRMCLEAAVGDLKTLDINTAAELASKQDGEWIALLIYQKCPALQGFLQDYYTVFPRQPWANTSARERMDAAIRIIELAKTNPKVVLPFWDILKKEIEKRPSEESGRYDEKTGYTAYHGVGIPFPDKPEI